MGGALFIWEFVISMHVTHFYMWIVISGHTQFSGLVYNIYQNSIWWSKSNEHFDKLKNKNYTYTFWYNLMLNIKAETERKLVSTIQDVS